MAAVKVGAQAVCGSMKGVFQSCGLVLVFLGRFGLGDGEVGGGAYVGGGGDEEDEEGGQVEDDADGPGEGDAEGGHMGVWWVPILFVSEESLECSSWLLVLVERMTGVGILGRCRLG